jgi:TonB-dependent Receptor Plug Domain/CarboxypepD_reg-like domain
MMKIKHFLLACTFFIFWGFPTYSIAQYVVLSGYVLSEENEPLVGASIIILGTGASTSTNNYGFYSLRIKSSPSAVRYNFAGVQPDTINVDGSRDTSISVKLLPFQFKEVEIVATSSDEPYTMSRIILPLETIKKIPSLGGEIDILKALSFVPGINNGSEGQSGLFVRGGSTDQNLILLDNAPVYNPTHLFGFLSVFNPDALKNVELYKGGFPARFGGRLSSVLDVQMKEGSKKRVRGDIGIGLISSRILVEGPLAKKKGSFLVAARSAYLGVLLFPLRLSYNSGNTSDYTGYNMYDLNVKFNRQIAEKKYLYFSFYSGRDRLLVLSEQNTKTKLDWGNVTSTLRYTQQLSERVFWKNILYFARFSSAFDYRYQSDQSKISLNSLSGLFDIGAKSDLDYYWNDSHTLKTGVEYVYHSFFPISTTIQSEEDGVAIIDTSSRQSNRANEFSIYVEDAWIPFSQLSFNMGVRLNLYKETAAFAFLQPSFIAQWKVLPLLSINAGFNYSYQNVHLASNTNLGFPNDVWLPATNRLAPGTSLQWMFGLNGTVPNLYSNWVIELYRKTLSNQIDYRENVNPLLNTSTNWEDLIVTGGTGISQGVEVGMTRNKGRFTGMVAYTFSKTTRRFDDINNGNDYRFNYDYPHLLNSTFTYDTHRKWSFSGTFVFRSGQPYSFPDFALNSPNGGADNPLFFYGSRNNIRLPYYMRIDVGAFKSVKTKRDRDALWSFSIYNLLNRKNILYAQIGNFLVGYKDNQPIYRPRLELKSFLPIIPSVAYSIKF